MLRQDGTYEISIPQERLKELNIALKMAIIAFGDEKLSNQTIFPPEKVAEIHETFKEWKKEVEELIALNG